MSAPKLITPNAYSFTELVVGIECRKRPIFIIITIAAKVTDRPFRSHKWGVKGSHLQGGTDRTGDPILTNVVCHATHVVLSLKLEDHEGLSFLVHGQLPKRTLFLILSAILIQIPICAFLSPVPAHCRVQSGTSWCCLAASGGMPASWNPTPKNSVSVLYILFYNLHY